MNNQALGRPVVFRGFARLILCSAFAALLLGGTVEAATIYWDGPSASWNTAANWSTASGATTPDPSAAPGSLDAAIFNITTANAATTITLAAAQAAQSLTFSNTGTTTLTGGGTARTLTLVNGITMAAGAGAVTLGDGTAGNNVLINLAAGQTWVNNTANAFTINNTAASFTRATGSALTFNQASTGLFSLSTTVLPNSATGIIGPWAFFGTGANTRYAYNNAGTIAGLTGTAAATAANLTDTTGTVNYDLADGSGTIGAANFSANIIRYTGAAKTTAPGATSFTVNGLLNAGSGLWTIGVNPITIGSTKELVADTANNDITISSPISDNTGGASALTVLGTKTLTLSGNNSYSGGLTVGGTGSVTLNNATAAGTGTLSLKSAQTSSFTTLGLSGGITVANAIQMDSTTGREWIKSTGTGNNALTGGITVTGAGGNSLVIDNSQTSGTLTVSSGLSGATYAGGLSLRGSLAGDVGIFNGAINAPAGGMENAGAANWTLNTAGSVVKANAQFAGGITIQSSGGFNLGVANALPAAPLSFAAGATGKVNLNGYDQTLAGVQTYAPITTGNGGIIINSSATTDSTLTLAALPSAASFTFYGTIQDGSAHKISLVMNSAGKTQILNNANTYSGNTTISAGTLALGASGSIANTRTISIAAGATFDVSAQASPYNLSSSTTLTASGTGTTVGTSAAAIKGASSGTVNLGTQPIILTYDGSNPALYVSQGTLQVQGNVWTVNKASALAASTAYNIASQASGTASVSGTHTVYGTAISGKTATITGSGANVVLTTSAAKTATTTAVTSGSSSYTYGTGSITYTATISPSAATGTVLFVVDGVSQPLATVSSGTATLTLSSPLAAGTHTITANYSGDSTYGSSVGTYSQTVTAKALTMSGLSVPASKVYDGTTASVVSGTPALQAAEAMGAGTGSDGKPYTGDTVSITGTATGTYNSKDVASASTVTYGGLSLTGGSAGNYTLTIQSAAAATVTTKPLTAQGTLSGGGKTYDGTTTATPSGSAALQSAEATGSSTSDGKPYTGDTVSLTGTAAYNFNSKDVATATTIAESGLSLTGAQAGNYTLTAPTLTAAITARPLTFTGSKTYDGSATATAVQLTFGNNVDGANLTMSGSVTLASANAGAPSISSFGGLTLGGPAAGNYTLIGASGSVTIGQENSTITYASSSFTYNGSAQTPTISFSGSTGAKTTNYVGTLVSYNSVNAPMNAGSYYVSNTVAADANYYGATNSQSFTIGAKAGSVTANPQTKTYGDVNPALTAVTNGAVNGDVINVTITTTATQYSAVGISNITVTAGSNPNYTVLTTNSTLTINTRPITLTAQPNTKIYDGGTSATNVPTLTSGTLASGDGFSTLSEAYSDPAVGTGKTVIPSAMITNASGTVTANYAITLVNDTASVIKPAQATTSLVLTNNVGVTNYYGQPLFFTAVVQTNSVTAANASSNIVFSLGGTPVWTNAVDGGVAYYTNTDLTLGATNFTAQYLGDNNYLGSSVTVTQTVLQTAPTVTLTASAITYGQTLSSSSLSGSAATNAYNSANVAGNFTFADAGLAPNAGSTNVWVVFTPTDTTNYTTASNTLAVAVNKANSTVTVTGTTSFIYNGTGQGPTTANVTGSGDLLSFSYSGPGYGPSANTPTNAGSYTVTATVSADDNYNSATSSPTVFSISPASASVTANPQTKNYGDVNPGLTATVVGQVVGGDAINYSLSTDASQFSSVGVSNIFVNLGSNPNYTVLTTNGTLTINPAATFVGATSTHNPSGYKDTVSYIATLPTDATGSVVFSSTNGAFSTNAVSSGSATSLSITNLPRGTNVITVAYLGDGNYLGSSTNLEQIVTNHPPMLAPLNLTRTAGLGLHFPWSQLTNQWSDVDGDVVTLTTFNLSTSNSVSLITNATLIGYPSSAPNVADQISYTASDSYGDTVAGVINIVVNAYVTGTNSIVNITTGNPTTLKAYGVIGFSYITERSTNLTDWASIATNAVSTNGVIFVSDSFSDLGGNPPSSAYYRIKWQP